MQQFVNNNILIYTVIIVSRYTLPYEEEMVHCKKRVSDFPISSQVVTNQTLPGRKLLNYSGHTAKLGPIGSEYITPARE
jgi:hypothetical protein